MGVIIAGLLQLKILKYIVLVVAMLFCGKVSGRLISVVLPGVRLIAAVLSSTKSVWDYLCLDLALISCTHHCAAAVSTHHVIISRQTSGVRNLLGVYSRF